MTVTNLPPEPVREGYSWERGGFWLEMSDGTIISFNDPFEREAAKTRALKKYNQAVLREAAKRFS